MKINSINNLQSKNLNIKNSVKVQKNLDNLVKTEEKVVTNPALYQAYNNVSFKSVAKETPFRVLGSVDSGEYISIPLKHFKEPILLKPDCVDTYFRDKTGEINADYVRDFVHIYDSFYENEVQVSENIKSLAKEIISNAEADARKSPVIDLPEGVIPFNPKKMKINYYTETNKAKTNANAYLYNEAENKKNFPIIALDKAFLLMQLSKTEDGYSFLNYNETKPIADELFMLSDKLQIDFKTPVLNAAKNEKGIVDLKLARLFTDYVCDTNGCGLLSLESFSNIAKNLRTNPNNDMEKVTRQVCMLSEIASFEPKEVEYFVNQCVNKQTQEFNEETFGMIMNLATEAEYSFPVLFDDFSDETMEAYEQIERELIHSYLKENNDEETGIIRDDADSIMAFTENFIANKKEELN